MKTPVQLTDEFVVKFRIVLFKEPQIVPVVRVQEVHQVEELADVVVQRRLNEPSEWGKHLEVQSRTPVIMIRCMTFKSLSFLNNKLLSLFTAEITVSTIQTIK